MNIHYGLPSVRVPLHVAARFNSGDKYFVVGMNPEENGGGIIGSANSLEGAHGLQIEAIKQNYGKVRVLTSLEFYMGE